MYGSYRHIKFIHTNILQYVFVVVTHVIFILVFIVLQSSNDGKKKERKKERRKERMNEEMKRLSEKMFVSLGIESSKRWEEIS